MAKEYKIWVHFEEGGWREVVPDMWEYTAYSDPVEISTGLYPQFIPSKPYGILKGIAESILDVEHRIVPCLETGKMLVTQEPKPCGELPLQQISEKT